MAEKKRSTGTTKKKTNSKSRSNKKNVTEKSMGVEIAIWISIAILLILELSNFGLCGKMSVVTDFLFGVFGIIEFILPVYVLIIILFIHINEHSPRAVKKTVYFSVLLLAISIFAQLISDAHVDGVKAVYENAKSAHVGGGVIGGGICMLSVKGIGVVGTYILLFVIAIIMIVLLTEISFLDIIKGTSTKVYDNINEANRASKERTAQRVKEYEESEEPLNDSVEDRRHRKSRFLDNLKVLPDDSNSKTVKDNHKVEHEDVHEIVMDFDMDELDDMPSSNTAMNPKPIKLEPVVAMDNLKDEDIVGGIEDTDIHDNHLYDDVEDEIIKPAEPEKPRRRASKKADNSQNDMEQATTAKEISNNISSSTTKGNYKFPSINLLNKGSGKKTNNDNSVKATAVKLQSVLASFGINVTITNYSCGPAVTRYEMQPEQGVKVSKITGLADDIMLNLAAEGIRIEAPIPGKAAIGIEIPNKENQAVMFRDLIDNDRFKRFPSDVSFAVGKDIGGETVVADIAKMPHLLIAGATGSGKSVCINTLIMSILYKAHPDDVKLIMVDPKVVELSAYNGIPHLLIPVVTDPKKAAGALNWAVMEMTDRYKLFAEYNVRNIKGYNDKVSSLIDNNEVDKDKLKKLPQIVVIVDELADLMMVAHGEVEDAIVRLAQLARAAGIHLVIATQRPSVDVITGLIKANIPSRIAFAVSSGVDSRTILDMVGAEKLLGKGDMLFYPTGYPKPVRVQGAFVSDEEVGRVVEFLKTQNGETTYDENITNQITNASSGNGGQSESGGGTDRDEYFVDAGKFIIDKNKASIGMLQRVYKIGFNRAARIMDQLCDAGVVSEEEGTKPRKVLMSIEEFEQYIEEYV